MSNKVLRKAVVTSVIMTAAFVFAGCGKGADVSKLDKSSILVNKDGTVESTVIEDFTESYYDVNELKSMAENEVNAFVVANGEGTAELKSLESKDGKVKMVIDFADSRDYAVFNSETFSYMTVSEAILTGQINVNSLIDSDGNPIDSEKAAALSDEHVVITGSKFVVAVPYKIQYMTSGVSLLDKQMADLSGTADGSISCIVLNK
ncbi:hypothetical protein [Butyrivibrio sp. AE3006]|uniref:hypothetical protein n=1 Tax=Butyrivibrio sp. AE3006 TaxID=1280673 RepID=UPI00042577CB|nr:hypothetical protein [Butyrivibrio sp. AE3006]